MDREAVITIGAVSAVVVGGGIAFVVWRALQKGTAPEYEALSTLGVSWQPRADIVATGDSIADRQTVPYAGGSQIESDTAPIQLPVKPGVRVLNDYVRANTGLTVGGPRPESMQAPRRKADGTLRKRDPHEDGRAGDAMTSNNAIGSNLASWLVQNAELLGVQLVVWRRARWASWRKRRGESSFAAYTGPSPHTDHVHYELNPEFANSAVLIQRALTRAPRLIVGGKS